MTLYHDDACAIYVIAHTLLTHPRTPTHHPSPIRITYPTYPCKRNQPLKKVHNTMRSRTLDLSLVLVTDTNPHPDDPHPSPFSFQSHGPRRAHRLPVAHFRLLTGQLVAHTPHTTYHTPHTTHHIPHTTYHIPHPHKSTVANQPAPTP